MKNIRKGVKKMKTFEKKVMRFVFTNRLKTDMLFYGVINGCDFYGNSYFFGRLSDNFFDKEKFKKVALEKIVKDYMINPDDERLVVTNFNITKGDNGLVLANFSISYGDDAPTEEVTCNYNYYKLFEKDCMYIYDTKGMICLYDERKALIGVIAKVVSY